MIQEQLMNYYDNHDRAILDRVQEELQALPSTGMDLSEALIFLALFYLEYRHDPDQAIETVEGLYDLNGSPEACLLKAYWQQGYSIGIDEAEKATLDALQLQNTDLSAFRLKICSDYFDQIDDLKTAEKLMFQSAYVKPNYVNAWIKITLSYAERGESCLAEETFSKAKQYIELLYTEVTADMLLNIDFYFKESVFGVYCNQIKLDSLAWMIKNGFR